MRINLKTSAARNEQQAHIIKIQDRLPEHLNPPCSINCDFGIRNFDNYYLLNLNSKADLIITCQRCLSQFNHSYLNQTELAICNSEDIAEQIMNHYDCIVAAQEIDLQEIITDELNLYTPEFHPDYKDCDHEIENFISAERE
ncbi:MAG: metal-binding protein [Tatlockia sp.]|nr:metal-binding protein [Tatlockia sp.]